MTAYRQEALACAAALTAGPQRPRDLKQAAPRAPKILLHNVYGWFERTDRGVYDADRRRTQGAGTLAAVGVSLRTLPLICLPGTSPVKDGEKFAARTVGSILRRWRLAKAWLN